MWLCFTLCSSKDAKHDIAPSRPQELEIGLICFHKPGFSFIMFIFLE